MENVIKRAKMLGEEISNAAHQLKKIAKKRIAHGVARVERGVNKGKEKIGDNKLGISFGKEGRKI